MKFLVVLSLCCLAVNAFPTAEELKAPEDGKTFVVLAGGGTGALDWSIQADIYHAFQVFVARGVPAENIIVMHRDNQANKKSNPTPGKVINVPGGPDVYHGVPKDYIGTDVTAKNFLGILAGDKTLKAQGKKVLESGPNDNVFVYLSDHGADQIVVFPQGPYLHAKELVDTIKTMHSDKKYAKLVVYIMACHSGSMFQNLLPTDINAYGMSSSESNKNSYATYYDKTYKEYLASLFAAAWMNDTEAVETESLNEQFTHIYGLTKSQQLAQQYGDKAVSQLAITKFEGAHGIHKAFNVPITETVDIRELPIALLEKRLEGTQDINEKLGYVEELKELLEGRLFLNQHIEEYVQSLSHLSEMSVESLLTPNHEITNGECYRNFVDTFHDKCFSLSENSYALSKLHVFINICENLDNNSANIALNQLVGHCAAKSALNVYKQIE